MKNVLFMTQDDVKRIITDIISRIAPEPVDAVKLDAKQPLREQLELDSMDFLDIVMALRKEHQIEVPEADYKHLETLQGCADYLLPKFLAKVS